MTAPISALCLCVRSNGAQPYWPKVPGHNQQPFRSNTLSYRLIAVRFAYAWHDDSGQRFRSYGDENGEFDANGLMLRRFASINDLPIPPEARKFHWPPGRRPDAQPGLGELGL